MDRMPPAPISEEVAALLDELGARPVNLYRALSNHDALAAAYIRFAWTLRRECRTPRKLREFVIVRAAQMAGSAYELDQHITMARNAGASERDLADLADWRNSQRFDSRDRAALAYAEEIQNLAVTDATVIELQKHFSRSETIELTVTAAFYAMVPRIIDALAVPLDGQDARLEIGGGSPA